MPFPTVSFVVSGYRGISTAFPVAALFSSLLHSRFSAFSVFLPSRREARECTPVVFHGSMGGGSVQVSYIWGKLFVDSPRLVCLSVKFRTFNSIYVEVPRECLVFPLPRDRLLVYKIYCRNF